MSNNTGRWLRNPNNLHLVQSICMYVAENFEATGTRLALAIDE